ncbi:MAG: CocE/NonD family hydrolase [Lachnospiraceae bacterium]|nr:CocE/NonD family hydrolase [Lachnospiraceae bacterium]
MKLSQFCETEYGKKLIDEVPLAPVYNEFHLKEEYVTMRDGTRLLCTIAFPVGEYFPLPVILLRTPYGIKSLRLFFEMAFYGYICVAQCCRGTFGSEGNWVPAKNEEADGEDTLKYIINSHWCNGKIAMTGTSYLSMNQWILADKLPPEVKTLNIEAYSPYRYDLLYTNRMFHLEAYAGWTAYNSGVKNIEFKGDSLYNEILKFKPQIKMDETLFGEKLPWYRNWVESSDGDEEFWNMDDWGKLKNMPQSINVPTLFNAGWYDPHVDGMLKAWNNLKEDVRGKSLFLTAPVNHKQSLCGNFPVGNAFEYIGTRFMKAKLLWFNHFLRGEKLELPQGTEISFIYGKNKWEEMDENENCQLERVLYFNLKNYKLDNIPVYEYQEPICFVYNPNKPVPTCGSEVIMTDYMYHKNNVTAEGIKLLPDVGTREDVISLLSEKFEEDILLISDFWVHMDVQTTAKDTAFTAKLALVNKNGDAYSLRSSITSVLAQQENYEPNTTVSLKIRLTKLHILIRKGEILRLDISSSDYPAFHIHPNTDKSWAQEENYITARQSIIGGELKFSGIVKRS